MSGWHDDDTFWTVMAPFMFDEARWEGTAAEIDLISELIEPAPGAAVLDLACGPGRHALELARRGYKVTGVDRTAVYLQQARQRAREAGLKVAFEQADMRDFRRQESFDVALSLFTSFGYFEEASGNARALRNVYDSLRADGILLIDIMGKEVLARIFQARNWSEQNGVYWLEERRVARNWSWMDLTWILIDGDRQQEFRLGHWLYSAMELEHMLRDAGFTGIDIYGDLAGRPYDLNAARLVIAARK